MTSLLRSCAVTAMLAFALLAVPHNVAASSSTDTKAPVPKVEEDSFPRVLPLTFEITPSDDRELKSFTELTVTIQEVEEDAATTVVGPLDPFTLQNTCVRPMPAGLSACLVNSDATVGTLRVEARIPRPGTYTFVITAKRGKGRAEKLLTFHIDALPGE
jgi:hypothetical protein